VLPPVHILKPNFFKLHFDIISHLRPGLSSDFPTNMYIFLISLVHAACLPNLFLYFITLVIFGEEYKLRSFVVVHISIVFFYFPSLCSKYSSQRWDIQKLFFPGLVSMCHQISCFKAMGGLNPPPYRAALSQQYSVASFATLRVASYFHSPGLRRSCCNVVRFRCALQACSLVTAATVALSVQSID
jgi:hypothetical protein